MGAEAKNQDRRAALDRETIVAVALNLLDEVGLDALSVRRLAAELGVKSPALYWHFRDKQELLDGMAQALERAQDLSGPAPEETWREWLARRARERRRLLLGRRDGARLVSGARSDSEALVRFDVELRILVEQGFTPVRALRTVMALGHYVIGFVLAEQSDLETGHAQGPPPEVIEALRRAPTLAEAIGQGGDPQSEAAFEHGLAMLIAGCAPSGSG